MAVGRYVFGLPHMYRYLSMYVCACSATVWIGQIWMGGGGGWVCSADARSHLLLLVQPGAVDIQHSLRTCMHVCTLLVYACAVRQAARCRYIRTYVGPSGVRA